MTSGTDGVFIFIITMRDVSAFTTQRIGRPKLSTDAEEGRSREKIMVQKKESTERKKMKKKQLHFGIVPR